MPHDHRNNLFKLENKCSEQFATSGDKSYRYEMLENMSHLEVGWELNVRNNLWVLVEVEGVGE